ncbi:alpha-1-antiproteinase 2-like [Lagopus leucura]|uniref:alpha-1-antiproteinase 2-like n=1 Tax=Lagopus leucura TaxID=30410 RepID=UPI001C664F2D|nr:alpha-1-antiproteinase 2-like [Lagopus leucura]
MNIYLCKRSLTTLCTFLLPNSKIQLYFPKFSISGSYEITNILSKMGIVDVFTNQADLSGITGVPELKVSKVVHKAALDVDERGTEAAATIAPKIMALTLAPAIEFNRPFLMLIFDRDTNSTLFIGKIANPTTTNRSEI